MKRMVVIGLACAVAGLAACGGPTGDSKQAPPAPPKAGVSSGAISLLPARNEVPGWDVSKPARVFTADNLWEAIDGAADGFVAYGVRQMVTAEYTQAGTGAQAVIELYEMKDPLNAFGKYSEERNPDYQFLKVGNEGYSGGSSLNFWTGPYYVKMTTFEEKDAVKQEMAKLAQSIAAKVSSPGSEPREVAYFPPQGQVAHSTKYIPADVLAQSYLTNGFETRYTTGDKKESKLVLVTMQSPQAAQEGLGRYRQYVAKNGKGVKDLKAPGEGGFEGKDSFYGNVAAVRAGRNLAVSLGMTTEEQARKMLAELVGNIK